VSDPADSRIDTWLTALEQRCLESLTFPELRRALQALSTWYVERRGELRPGTPFSSQGKRAAFALFYGPLHLLTVRRVVRELGAARPAPERIVDLGCGSGAAGAAWALEAAGRPRLEGVELNAWAAGEARRGWRELGLRGSVRRGDLLRSALPGRGGAIVSAYTVNELPDAGRAELLKRLEAAARKGAGLLIVEPIARRVSPWWDDWAAALLPRGVRADTWRFPAELPALLARLDRAAGLDHRELTARSLFVAPRD
jgi:hypothetical protein